MIDKIEAVLILILVGLIDHGNFGEGKIVFLRKVVKCAQAFAQ